MRGVFEETPFMKNCGITLERGRIRLEVDKALFSSGLVSFFEFFLAFVFLCIGRQVQPFVELCWYELPKFYVTHGKIQLVPSIFDVIYTKIQTKSNLWNIRIGDLYFLIVNLFYTEININNFNQDKPCVGMCGGFELWAAESFGNRFLSSNTKLNRAEDIKTVC